MADSWIVEVWSSSAEIAVDTGYPGTGFDPVLHTFDSVGVPGPDPALIGDNEVLCGAFLTGSWCPTATLGQGTHEVVVRVGDEGLCQNPGWAEYTLDVTSGLAFVTPGSWSGETTSWP